jgi:hypothetical protein
MNLDRSRYSPSDAGVYRFNGRICMKFLGAFLVILLLTGCAGMSQGEQRMVSGAAIGAVVGGPVGGGVGALFGAGVGAGVGYAVDQSNQSGY